MQDPAVECGGEHTLYVDTRGALHSAGACGLGWHAQMEGSMSAATLQRCADLGSGIWGISRIVSRPRKRMSARFLLNGVYRYHALFHENQTPRELQH